MNFSWSLTVGWPDGHRWRFAQEAAEANERIGHRCDSIVSSQDSQQENAGFNTDCYCRSSTETK